MRVGNLVVLSKKGSALKKNWRLLGAIGIVLEIVHNRGHYKIRWATIKGFRNYDTLMLRYELKCLRAK